MAKKAYSEEPCGSYEEFDEFFASVAAQYVAENFSWDEACWGVI